MLRIILLVLSISLIAPRLAISEPLHWQLQKGDVEIMVLGSVHLGNQSMYPLPDDVTEFLKQSNGLIIEADVRDTSNIQYPVPTTTTRSELTSAQIKQLTDISKKLSLPLDALFNSPPWATALTIQVSMFQKLGYKPEDGVDTHLVNRADKLGIPVLPLESLQFQINLLAGGDEGKELLNASLIEYEMGRQGVECLINAWKAGDAELLEKISSFDGMSEDFTKRLLTDRNRDWAIKLDAKDFYPSSGKYTLVVGALHLIGEGNLITLLQENGFKVRSLGQSKKAECSLAI